MNNKNSFCVFIISHGRPDNVVTLKSIKKAGYTGDFVIVCDNEDKTLSKYKHNYGSDNVAVFDKIEYAKKVDSCDNFNNRRTTTHARNACFDLAEDRGYEYFLVLDDDYTSFCYISAISKNTTDIKVRDFDALAEKIQTFLCDNKRIKTVCFLQSGDTIGGMDNFETWNRIFPFNKRKAMNSFFCKTDRRFWFFSRLNEDVNTYLSNGSRGDIFISIPQVLLQQKQTQATAGGMTEAYLDGGTYVKSFYTVMNCPSFAMVTVTNSMQRMHHKINWNNAVPKILSEEYKKNG